ncbi:LysE family translocator [Pararhodobacter aggregans]|uniref:LysE family translocator n=1 Tax=Pararhodobacter aggregans TaxID=404875 RepID=A0A2T7UW70_9RHOB|nr:LysE family translocator [Pararhodobacter aggregans]PTX04695.1 threonine/homoserine/homoserine lactone efflux protein [Pararhodobacter aggregans]PVE49033.1 LysE family translocator [Pararhodobacter aggregans]
MIDPVVLLAYIPAALALNLTPGADMMFCLGQGLRGGPRAAMAANLGIGLGSLVHVLIAGLGLGALVAAHPGLFDAIRWIGVAYLLFLAWKSLRASALPEVPRVSPRRAFREGLMVNLTNPKVILFVLAFIPQFVDPARAILPQFLLFGAIIGLGGLVVNGAVGLAAGGAAGRLMRSARFAAWLGRVSAAIFAGLALRLALIQRG